MPQLDLKYRPQTFSEVLGNDSVKKLLLIRSQNRTIGDQSMMLSGPKGCGKTTLARIIARSLSCTSIQNGEPCNECPICLSIINETNPSFEEMDAASHGTVEKVRNMVSDSNYGTIDGARQVYIVDEAQRLSQAAQEAFLKAIESRLFTIILCTTDPQKVKIPIRSRLEEYPVYTPPPEELKKRIEYICIEENIKYDDSGIDLLMKVKENCPRTCFIALDTVSQLGPISEESIREYFRFDSYELVDKVLSSIDVDPKRAFKELDQLSNQESPTWIKDHIVMAISSALREGVGAKPTFVVPTNFFQNRGKNWATIATDLSRIDKINISDIESILMREANIDIKIDIPERIQIKEEKKISETPPPNVEEEKAPEKAREIKKDEKPVIEKEDPRSAKEVLVDGMRFSYGENLTTLDNKIRKTSSEQPDDNRETVIKVGLDPDHAPMSEKEFSNSFLERLGKT